MRGPGEEKSIIRWGEALGGEGLPHCLGNAGLTGLCRVRGPWGEGACHPKAAARRKVGESGAGWWVGVVFPWLLLWRGELSLCVLAARCREAGGQCTVSGGPWLLRYW